MAGKNEEVTIGEILLDKETIQARVQILADEISKNYEDLVIIAVLNGGMFFAVDLMRALTIPCSMTTLSIGSYGQRGATSGVVRLNNDIQMDIEGRNVLFVEDIIDTGKTMQYLLDLFEFRKPASLGICSFLSKPGRREISIDIDYLGFEIPDQFVIGYGLDYKEQFRALPYIAVAELG